MTGPGMEDGVGWGRDLPDVIRGCWQLSRGHGLPWTREEAFAVLDRAASEEASLSCSTWATSTRASRNLVGAWLRKRTGSAASTRVHTKFVPDLADLGRVDRAHVRRSIARSLTRLGVDALDLIQFHWWDFSVAGWVEVVSYLDEERRAGRVGAIGVTNFDADRLRVLLDAGLPVVSNQVQLSLLDRRPLAGLSGLCVERGVRLLCYGHVGGGAPDRFMAGEAASRVRGRAPDPSQSMEPSWTKWGGGTLCRPSSTRWPKCRRAPEGASPRSRRRMCSGSRQ